MKVVGLGAGGHAKVVIEVLHLCGQVEMIGLLDPDETLWHTRILGVSVLGGDGMLPEVYAQGVRHAFIGLGGSADMRPRQRLYELVQSQGFEAVAAIHPSAIVSPSAQIGRGPTIMAGVVINANAKLGENVIVNTGAIVEHDCVIGNHVHIATGAKLASTVQVGDGTQVGISASIRQGIRVGRNVTVGAGAVVVDDVPDDVVIVGVPARILRRKRQADG